MAVNGDHDVKTMRTIIKKLTLNVIITDVGTDGRVRYFLELSTSTLTFFYESCVKLLQVINKHIMENIEIDTYEYIWKYPNIVILYIICQKQVHYSVCNTVF